MTTTTVPQAGSLRAQIRDVLTAPENAGKTVSLKWLVRQVNTKGLAEPDRTVQQVMAWIIRVDLVPGLTAVTRGKQWRCPTSEQAELTSPEDTIEKLAADPALAPMLTVGAHLTILKRTAGGTLICSDAAGQWYTAKELA